MIISLGYYDDKNLYLSRPRIKAYNKRDLKILNMGEVVYIMMQSYFIAHGSPSIVLEDSEYTRFLIKLSKEMPKPKAIIIFSAHFESAVQIISGAERYKLIYDFSGFPKEMYNIQYPVKGNPELAEEIYNLFKIKGIKSEIDRCRGIDHGAWSILKLMFPKFDIPVINLSVNPSLSPKQQFKIGESISTFREKDILIIGSGGIVHNLSALKWNRKDVEPWAFEFNYWVQKNIEMQLLLGAAGVEADHRIALLQRAARRRQPDDGQIRQALRSDQRRRAARRQLSMRVHQHQKLAFAYCHARQLRHRTAVAHTYDPGCHDRRQQRTLPRTATQKHSGQTP